MSRTVAVLGAFTTEHPRLTLTEVAAASGVPASTARRLLLALCQEGVVVREVDGSYRVGLRLWSFGRLVALQLCEAARPWLLQLLRQTRESVHLATRDGSSALVLDTVAEPGAVDATSPVGERLPLHATSVGKVLLAHEPPAIVREYLAKPLARPTRYTVATPDRLATELRTVRCRGWASTREELTLGICSVAAPVRLPGGDPSEQPPLAAVGVVLPSRRSPELAGLAPLVLGTARRIEDELERAAVAHSLLA